MITLGIIKTGISLALSISAAVNSYHYAKRMMLKNKTNKIIGGKNDY